MKTFNVAITPEIKEQTGAHYRTGRSRVDVHTIDGETIFDEVFASVAEAQAAFKIALAIQAANK